MISKNNILLISTQSVFNTENVNNGIESNPESNGMNIDESINLDTGESTSWMDVDESIKPDTGVGTKRVYGVEVSPGKVNCESTASTDKDESVLRGNRFMASSWTIHTTHPIRLGLQANSELEGVTHLVSSQRTFG